MSHSQTECPLCRAQARDGLVCGGCVANTLYYKQQAIAYKKVALRDAFDQAQAKLAAQTPVLAEERALTALVRRQAELRDKLRQTAERVRSLRPTVARRKFILEDRRRALRGACDRLGEMERGQAGRMGAVGEGLRWYIEQAKEAVQQRMWTRVLEHFVVLPIEADLPCQPQAQASAGRARGGGREQQQQLLLLGGVSTIAGVPLPNSGRYNSLGLPDEVCEAALYLVARLTHSLAKTFEVTLPHPLLFPEGKAYAVIAEDADKRTEYALSPGFYKRASRAAADGNSGSKGGNSTGGAGGGRGKGGRGGGAMDGASGRAPRTPDGAAADPFAIGLEYLQYDVHRLAIAEEVGVDLSELWGKEALLLNLWTVQQHAARLVQSYEGTPDPPLPLLRRLTRHGGEQPAPANQPWKAPQPTVVFRERPAEDEWSLVDLHLKNNSHRSDGGVGGLGATTMPVVGKRGGGGVRR